MKLPRFHGNTQPTIALSASHRGPNRRVRRRSGCGSEQSRNQKNEQQQQQQRHPCVARRKR
jgi:hypothetical protein